MPPGTEQADTIRGDPPLGKSHSEHLVLKMAFRPSGPKRGAARNRGFSSKQPSVQRTWQWGLNPSKSSNVWMAITAPEPLPFAEPAPSKHP